jgi:hypothetical protein
MPDAGDFHVFPVLGGHRGPREHFLRIETAHDFIGRFGPEHDIDRATAVAVARRRRSGAYEDINEKGTHGLSRVRRAGPIPTAPRRSAMQSTRRSLPHKTGTFTQTPCQFASRAQAYLDDPGHPTHCGPRPDREERDITLQKAHCSASSLPLLAAPRTSPDRSSEDILDFLRAGRPGDATGPSDLSEEYDLVFPAPITTA